VYDILLFGGGIQPLRLTGPKMLRALAMGLQTTPAAARRKWSVEFVYTVLNIHHLNALVLECSFSSLIQSSK
jgi:hypothetical protein